MTEESLTFEDKEIAYFLISDIDKLKSYLLKKIKGAKEDKVGNIHYVKGRGKILVTAHLDTVFSPPKKVYYSYTSDKKLKYSGEINPIGADDRAGCWALYKHIKETDKDFYAIFTVGEETGGYGAQNAVFDKKYDFQYIVSLDRYGANNVCFYDIATEEFRRDVLALGFEETFGGFTDACVFAERFNVCGVNVSVGYMQAHTSSEYLIVDDLKDSIYKHMKIFSLNKKYVYDYYDDIYMYGKYRKDYYDFKAYYDFWAKYDKYLGKEYRYQEKY
ncbi:hypothetical protein [Caldisericum sp.]|uniref:hypothetical protein n=1 Tax=Caldisericum sp. TaxID=2499687 RepID=UPI003D096BD5